MKKYFTLLLFLLPFISFSQPYGNEWIHFNQTYYKIKVVDDGVYRIRQSTLAAAIPSLSSITGANFQLFERGVEIPIYVSSNNTGDANFYIEFYAVHNNGWFDSSLYEDHSWQVNDELSLFNDTAAYFLTWNNLTTNVRYTTITNNLAAHPPKENYCWFKDVSVNGGSRIYGSNYSLGVPTYPAGNGDICSSEFGITEGYGSPGFNYNVASYPLNTAHVYLNGPAATVNAQYIGIFPTDHNVETGIGSTVFDLQTFYGYETKRVSFQVSNLNLINSSTTNCFVSTANSLAQIADVFQVCNMKIKYPRQFNFDNATSAKFSLNAAGGNQYIVIKNFNEQNTQPVLYDLTSHVRIVGTSWTAAADSDQFVLPGWVSEHECVLVSNNLGAINDVTVLKQRNFTDYSLPANQGDFIILTHPFFYDDGNGHNYINDYKNLKAAGGFTPVVVDVTELYDQFGYGIDLHPMPVRQFSHLAKNTWGQPKLYLFLIGKGLNYTYFNENVASKEHCYVPTWGRPGSDILLTATDTSDIPLVSTGRIPCLTADDVKTYLDKVHDFLDIQNDTAGFQQTNDLKLWTKNIVHVAGGSTTNDQNLFRTNLNNYKKIAEDSISFGADVHSFFKNSTDPVQIPTGHQLDSLLDNGVSMLTFFGHSAASTFDYQIPLPEEMNNDYGKYPLFYTNGCLVGDVFQNSRQLADRYILTDHKGVIGFLASDFFGFDGPLNSYATNFYKNVCLNHYNEAIGDIVRHNIEDLYVFPASGINRSTFQQIILNMDPSLQLMTHSRPDYDIENSSVWTSPKSISAGIDSFQVFVDVTNIGKAILDSFNVDITRHLPDGANVSFSKRIKAPYLRDTVSFTFTIDALLDLGPNQFDVYLDQDDEIDEMENMLNNHISFTKIILSNDIIPVWPYEFSIVSAQGVTLKGSTVDPLAPMRNYVFQIDTTEKFNSAMLQTTPMLFQHTGGVVEWTPTLNLIDSTVYYWRASVDTGQEDIHDYSWHNSSFIYLNGSSPGWNQSHYFQFKKDLTTTLKLDTTRVFKFPSNIVDVGFLNGNYYNNTVDWDEVGVVYINGTRYARWGFINPTFLFVHIDGHTGAPVENNWMAVETGEFNSYHNYNSGGAPLYSFQYNSNNTNLYTDMQQLIASIPNGDYLAGCSLVANWNNSWGVSLMSSYPAAPPTMMDTWHSLGLHLIDSAGNQDPYVFLIKKGDTTAAGVHEALATPTTIVNTDFFINGNWDRGYFESTVIGPAVSWSNFHYRAHEIEPGNDHYNVEIYGIDTSGNKILLSTMSSLVFAGDTDIHLLNAAQYPFLQLRLNVLDSVTNSPLQLDYWRINYQPFPEVAVDPSAYFVLQNTDTVAQRVPFKMQVALRNVSAYDFDSVYVKYQITDANNGMHFVYKTEKPILALDTIHASLNFATTGFAGLNQMFMEINPKGVKHEQEQYHFNNYLLKPFNVTTDNLNPLLDVTFDGIHILNNDIVSAKPEIVIKLNDDSKLVPLDDTSGISVKLTFPDGSIHPVHYNNSTATFYPADVSQLSTKNQAEVIYKPVLLNDGVYTLTVQGYDRGGNAAGNYDYSISFEVINKAMISNVLNYPNPFTTQTHFVFTLTGSVVPEFMKIQIMNISGKVVKEIFMNELGPLHIGRNITEYMWDGTDQYGDNLGNGVYLYRVVTRLDGKNLDEYGTNTDQYFKEGIGKMVLAR